jgi:hypothetical protein
MKRIYVFLLLILSSCEKEVMSDEYEIKIFSNSPQFGSVILVYQVGSQKDSLRINFPPDEFKLKFVTKGPVQVDLKLRPETKKELHLHLYKNKNLIQYSSAYDFKETAKINGKF